MIVLHDFGIDMSDEHSDMKTDLQAPWPMPIHDMSIPDSLQDGGTGRRVINEPLSAGLRIVCQIIADKKFAMSARSMIDVYHSNAADKVRKSFGKKEKEGREILFKLIEDLTGVSVSLSKIKSDGAVNFNTKLLTWVEDQFLNASDIERQDCIKNAYLNSMKLLIRNHYRIFSKMRRTQSFKSFRGNPETNYEKTQKICLEVAGEYGEDYSICHFWFRRKSDKTADALYEFMAHLLEKYDIEFYKKKW